MADQSQINHVAARRHMVARALFASEGNRQLAIATWPLVVADACRQMKSLIDMRACTPGDRAGVDGALAYLERMVAGSFADTFGHAIISNGDEGQVRNCRPK